MCGIAGYLNLDASTTRGALTELVSAMSAGVRHRGPDDQGIWVDERVGLGLAHRRLAIVDLSSEGHQPMSSADGRWTLVFNGELYNHLEIRKALQVQGIGFRGTSDTEVLVEAIAAWGLDESLRRANAMFAFGLWDAHRRQLHLVRDRLGEKPLYWSLAGARLVFASELRAVRKVPGFAEEIDRDALAGYFARSFVAGPATIFEGVQKLPPGTVLTIGDGRSEPALRPFWSLDDAASADLVPIRDEDAVDELDALLRDAVRLRSSADVPLGAFLSGGIDSSTVVALMAATSGRPVQTFTIGFGSSNFDEAAPAAAVAKHLGCEHHLLEVSPELALASVERAATAYDEPFGDPSALPTLLVCGAARRHLTVALTGDGGDEVFAGYNRHVLGASFWRRAEPVPLGLRRGASRALAAVPTRVLETAARPASRWVRNPADKLDRLGRILPSADEDDLARRLVETWATPPVLGGARMTEVLPLPRSGSFAERMAYVDTRSTLPDDMLVKVDRASMHVALEVRVPLLDHRVVEWAWQRPFDVRMRGGVGKWALREVLARYVPRVLTDRPKMGFDPPIGDWLRGPLRAWAEDLLPRRSTSERYLDVHAVTSAWDAHQKGQRNATYELWAALMFESWLAGLRTANHS